MQDWVAHESLSRGDVVDLPSFLCESADPERCLVDLSALAWVGPATLAGLSAFMDGQIRKGRDITFLSPREKSVSNYLSRMGLGRILDTLYVEHSLAPVNADISLNEIALVELSQFSCSEDIERLVAIVFNNNIPDELKFVICRALIETGNNVPEHARVEHGYMAAQVSQHSGTLRIAVADSGAGLLGTLGTRGATSEREALRMAVAGVSEKTGEGAGRGLSGTRSALKAHSGVGMLLSGSASLTMSSAHDAPWLYRDSFEGTVFGAQLPLGPRQ